MPGALSIRAISELRPAAVRGRASVDGLRAVDLIAIYRDRLLEAFVCTQSAQSRERVDHSPERLGSREALVGRGAMALLSLLTDTALSLGKSRAPSLPTPRGNEWADDAHRRICGRFRT